ncbi:hypothetical protein CONPUDRAFT_166555 [Coniophora puteana RWD-64-598 SS2]|uniref:F-box domain-containing protein n=1 Tax=Coniophora puteana (strain RWD-64-598) TaxID=741705 RepID=A0A5M3MLG0_CONPW|nr:uncharacterized protein CONPUDRAFT_166555 [Coniophora puteana RWD-64-598 SS2]EIW79867.1 hypothetical protein CONPUDRAFT_166555 [Coniophora puteana RWD-64-598 SS2]
MTCKSLQGPALNALYYELGCLACVFMCMPKSLWEITIEEPQIDGRGKQSHNKHSFCRVMRKSDWRILQKYLPRVRVLRSDTYSAHMIVDVGVLSAVSCYCGPSLLPNIQHLHLGDRHFPYFMYMLHDVVLFPRLLLGTRLTTLDLHGHESKTLPVLTIAADTCPFLKSIHISFCGRIKDEILEIIEVIAYRLKKLESIYLDLKDDFTVSVPQILSVLASLSLLTDISLKWCIPTKSLRSTSSTIPWAAIRLPALRNLHIQAQPLQVIQVMKTLQDLTSLNRLSVMFNDVGADTAVPEAIGIIAKTLITTSAAVRDIEILFPHSDNTGLLPFDALRPLFRFHNLTRFRVEECPHPAWDDAMLEQLARSFPNLTHLNLLWNRSPYVDMGDVTDTNITLRGLASLLLHCPKFQMLALAVDVTSSEDLDDEDSDVSHVCHTPLTHWQVYNSVIEDDDDVDLAARTLARIAPDIESFVPLEIGQAWYLGQDAAVEDSIRQ